MAGIAEMLFSLDFLIAGGAHTVAVDVPTITRCARTFLKWDSSGRAVFQTAAKRALNALRFDGWSPGSGFDLANPA